MGSQACKEPAGDRGVKVESPTALVIRNREDSDDLDSIMNTEGTPQCLWIDSPKGQRHVTGEYILAAHDIHNGHPVWVKGDTHSSGDKWLYSSNIGTWNIGGQSALERNFQCHSAYIFCAVRHRGSMPHTFQGLWWRATGHGFVEDASINVMVAEPRKAPVQVTSTSKYGKAAPPRSAPGRGAPLPKDGDQAEEKSIDAAGRRGLLAGADATSTAASEKVSAAADAAEAGKSAAAAAEAARAAASAAAAAVEAVKAVSDVREQRGASSARHDHQGRPGSMARGARDRPKDKDRRRSRRDDSAEMTPKTPWGLPNGLFQVDPRALRRSLVQLQTERRTEKDQRHQRQEVDADDQGEEWQGSDRADRRSSSRHRHHPRRQDDRYEADFMDCYERDARSDCEERRHLPKSHYSSTSPRERRDCERRRPQPRYIMSPSGRSVNSKASSHLSSRYSCDEEVEAPEPPPSLEVGFLPALSEAASNRTEYVRKCIFTTRPLGMKFEANRTPLTVRSVTQSGVAEFLGVEKGMRIVTIDGMDVSRLGYGTVQSELESRYSKLPAKSVLV